jgi:DNA-binding transcriptional LysR family regulator
MDLLAAFRAFVRVAETGSFSAVARETGLTQPAISRQVAALEQHLGARLVHRTTRSVGLTEDGRDLLAHARSVLEAVERAEGAVGQRRGGVSGMVRLSAPVVFGRVLIAPRIHSLLERHPRLSVDLLLDDRPMDLVQEGVDVAIRIGELPPDAPFIARRLGAFQRLVVASAAYLARNPEPLHPSDLARHECVLFDRHSGRGIWTLNGPEGEIEVPVEGRFHTDSPEAAREAVLTGLGLAVLSAWLVRNELRDGTVRAVLQAWKPPLVPVHAVYPSQRNLAARTRALIEFLLTDLQLDPQLAELWAP